MQNTVQNDFLKVFRLLLLIGALAIPAFRFFLPPAANDPMWMRLILSGVMLVGILGSLNKQFINRYLLPYSIMIQGVVLLWSLIVLYLNGFAMEYFVGFLMLAFTIYFTILNKDSLLFLVGGSVFGLLLAAYGQEEEVVDWNMVATTAAGLVCVGIVLYRRFFRLRDIYEAGLDTSFINYTAVGASRDGILIVDPEGNFIRGNATFMDYMDIPQEWIKENRLQEAADQSTKLVKDKERFRNFVTRNPGEGEVEAAEEFEMLDGRTLEVSYVSISRAGKLMGRMWIFRDITARKQFERDLIASGKAIRERNELLSRLAADHQFLEGSEEAVFEEITQSVGDLLNVDTVAVWFFNEDQTRLVCQKGYRPGDDEFHEQIEIELEDYPEYMELMIRQRLLAVRDTRKLEATSTFHKGLHNGASLSICHAQIRSGKELIGVLCVETDHVRDWSVEDQGFVASMADFVALGIEQSRRRKMSEQLASYNEILTTTFELSETGILVVDEQQNALIYNELYLEIWDMSADFVENSSYPEKMDHILGQIESRESREEEEDTSGDDRDQQAIIYFKDGRIVERFSKAIDLGKRGTGRVWFYLDVTERVQREKQLIERNFELDSFVYRASHDLKAPLNSIMGLIEIIREEKEVQMILRYVQMMDKSVRKLEDFIKQLTQFSQDARLKVVRKPIHFEEMLQEVWKDLSFMDNADRVRFNLDAQQNHEFYGDPVRLSIVLNNLISNAIKYQDLTKPFTHIDVTVRADEESGTVKVRDNGVGISKEHVTKVFELFFRASVQATGSGLGLYITKSAVEKMGGKLEVESELGEGTTFMLTVPNHIQEVEESNILD